jgi:hypothetical protein
MSEMMDERFVDLLKEYDEHRAAIKSMIKDLEDIKKDIDRLIPKTLDARMARYFEEKVKAMTALFGTLLDMRKEIAKSVKDEIEIRRKVSGGGDVSEELEKYLDVRQFAKKVVNFQREKEKLIKGRAEKEELPEIEGE